MILHLKNNNYIDSEAYGLTTWGSENQTYIIKKQKYWYIVNSTCFDPRHDDWTKTETKLDVIEELTTVPKDCILNNQSESEYFRSIYKKEK